MKKIQSLAVLFMVLLFTISCSETEVEDPEVVFTNMSTSKTDLYIEEAVTITIEGSGYTDVNLTSNTTKVKIKKLASTVFEITATEATSAKIYAELKNNSKL